MKIINAVIVYMFDNNISIVYMLIIIAVSNNYYLFRVNCITLLSNTSIILDESVPFHFNRFFLISVLINYIQIIQVNLIIEFNKFLVLICYYFICDGQVPGATVYHIPIGAGQAMMSHTHTSFFLHKDTVDQY